MRLLFFALVLTLPFLSADTVYFKDGREPMTNVETEEDGSYLAIKRGESTVYIPLREIDRVEKGAVASKDDGSGADTAGAEETQYITLRGGKTFSGRVLPLGKRVRVRTSMADFWVEASEVEKIWEGRVGEVEELEESYGSGEQVAVFHNKGFSVRAPDGWLIESNPPLPLVDAVITDEDRRGRVELSVISVDAGLYANPSREGVAAVQADVIEGLEQELGRLSRKPKVTVSTLPNLGIPAYKVTYAGRFRLVDDDSIFEEYRFASASRVFLVRAVASKADFEALAAKMREAVGSFSVLGKLDLTGTVYTDSGISVVFDALDPEWNLTMGLTDSSPLLRVLFDDPNRFFELWSLPVSADASPREAAQYMIGKFREDVRRMEITGDDEVSIAGAAAARARFRGILGRRGHMEYLCVAVRTPSGAMLGMVGNYKVPRSTPAADQICIETMASSVRFLQARDEESGLTSQKQARAKLFQAEIALDERNFAAALEMGTEALALFPRYAKAMRVMGAALLELNRYDEAIDYYQKASLLEPDPHVDAILADIWREEGVELLEKGKWTRGIRLLERAYRSNVSSKDFQKGLLKAYEGYCEFLESDESLKYVCNYVERIYRRFDELPGLIDLVDRYYRSYAKESDKEKKYDRAISYSKKRLKLWEGNQRKLERIQKELDRYIRHKDGS